MNQELITHWLWMRTMEYALHELKWQYKHHLYPPGKECEWRYTNWEEMQKVIFTYILENWETQEYRGSSSGDNRYEVGYHLQMDSQGVVGNYDDTTVVITWPEVRRFIKKLISDEDKQLDMFQMLIKEAGK